MAQHYDSITEKAALDGIYMCQKNIVDLNTRVVNKIRKLHKRHKGMEEVFVKARDYYIQKIPNFWATAFANHPEIAAILDEEEEERLRFLSKLEVKRIKRSFGCSITFRFSENPFFTNEIIKKEFRLGTCIAQSSQVKWKEGMEPLKDKGSRKKGIELPQTFFSWLSDQGDASANDIAEVIRRDLWQYPLKYFLGPDFKVKVDGLESEEDGLESEEDAKSETEPDENTIYIIEEEAGEVVEDEDMGDPASANEE